MTGYLLEGTNIADVSDKAPSSMAGVLLGVDAVKEFSVQTHNYAAEYGRAAGGVISAVTKSGTNALHARCSNSCATASSTDRTTSIRSIPRRVDKRTRRSRAISSAARRAGPSSRTGCSTSAATRGCGKTSR